MDDQSLSLADKGWIEEDTNPFFLFNQEGKIAFINKAAEAIISFLNIKELYQVSINDAPLNFGYSYNEKSLHFYRYEFYGYLIGYTNNKHIGIRLYKGHSNPMVKPQKTQKSNLHKIIQLIIALHQTVKNLNISLSIDSSLPELYINEKDFINCLNKIFSSFDSNNHLNIMVNLKVGEHIIINNERHSIIKLNLNCNRSIDDDNDIITDIKPIFCYYSLNNHNVWLELPVKI